MESIDVFLSKWCFLTLLGFSFSVLRRGQFTNLAMSAQLTLGAIFACEVGAATGSSVLAAFACYLAGMIVLMPSVIFRAFGDVSDVLSTLLTGFFALPLSAFFLSARGTRDLSTITVPEQLRQSWLLTTHLSVLHILAPVIVGVLLLTIGRRSGLYFRLHVIGYDMARLGRPSGFMALVWAASVSTIVLTAAVMGDAFLIKGSYQEGHYDLKGFIGVAVGILALDRIYWVPIAAALVALTETLSLELALVGLPSQSAFLIYGLLLWGASLYLGGGRTA